MKVSNCCGAAFPEPGYPDTDLCGLCYEHTEAITKEIEKVNAGLDWINETLSRLGKLKCEKIQEIRKLKNDIN